MLQPLAYASLLRAVAPSGRASGFRGWHQHRRHFRRDLEGSWRSLLSRIAWVNCTARDPRGPMRYIPARDMIRTKIVATMGPACGDVETLFRLFEAGADVCRLNFSHGTLENHLLMLRNIREAAARYSHPIAILGDLGGPKIRLGSVADE